MTNSSYMRNAWYMVCWARDLTADAPLAATVLEQPLVLYRTADGRAVALEDRCCHRLAPLSLGRVEGNDIRCLYHGLKFTADGVCCEMPGRTTPPQAMRVRAYPLIERYSGLFVWMGDAARADESLLPNFVGVDDPRWRMLPGRMDYDADYTLIQDNLLDLSHVAWVHRNSFGAGDAARNQAWAAGEVTIRELPRGVRVTRWILNTPTPPRQQAQLGANCDRWSSFDYLAPGFFLMQGAVFAAGSVAVRDDAPPLHAAASRSFTAQAVTPLSRQRTAYHFAFGPAADEPDADTLQHAFHDLALRAFAEDKALIEAQQKIIDADPSRSMLLFEVDKAPALYQRVLQRLLASD